MLAARLAASGSSLRACTCCVVLGSGRNGLLPKCKETFTIDPRPIRTQKRTTPASPAHHPNLRDHVSELPWRCGWGPMSDWPTG